MSESVFHATQDTVADVLLTGANRPSGRLGDKQNK